MTQADLTQDEIDTTLRDVRPLARSRSTFYFGMAIAMSVTVFIGFGPSFYVNAYFAEALGLPPVQSLSSIIIVHGLVFTTWMILLMVQTGLGGFTSLIAFAGLAGAAIGWRRRPEIHKRLILIATIALLGAATARIGGIVGVAVPALGPLPFLGLVLTDLFLVALLVHDWRTARRPHAATLYGGLVVLAMQAVNNSPLPHHPAVIQLMRWLAG